MPSVVNFDGKKFTRGSINNLRQIKQKVERCATLHSAVSQHSELIICFAWHWTDRCDIHVIFQDQAAEAAPSLPTVPAGEIAEEVVLPEVPKEKLPSESHS